MMRRAYYRRNGATGRNLSVLVDGRCNDTPDWQLLYDLLMRTV